ncbi:MAG: DUF4386 domain-containing protein [Spirochaetaceae bacterium]
MKNLKKLGGIAALYEGAAYIIGMLFFIFLLDYSGIDSSVKKVAFFIDNQTTIYILNLIIYVFFGVFMIILSLALYNRLKEGSQVIMLIATSLGLIWSTLVIAAGMIHNIGMETVINLYSENPEQAGTVWLAIESIADGIGGGNEIVGGLWILLVSIAALKIKKLPKALNIIGIIVGCAGVLSTIPPLAAITAIIFGMIQIVWFIWLGIYELSDKS